MCSLIYIGWLVLPWEGYLAWAGNSGALLSKACPVQRREHQTFPPRNTIAIQHLQALPNSPGPIAVVPSLPDVCLTPGFALLVSYLLQLSLQVLCLNLPASVAAS